MKKEEKIAKLKELGLFGKWNKNVSDQPGLSGYDDSEKESFLLDCLEDDSDWREFIGQSFPFYSTPEGVVFWQKIRNIYQ